MQGYRGYWIRINQSWQSLSSAGCTPGAQRMKQTPAQAIFQRIPATTALDFLRLLHTPSLMDWDWEVDTVSCGVPGPRASWLSMSLMLEGDGMTLP